jgi:hypothetical protein
MSDHSNIERIADLCCIADLCLNYKTPKMQFDDLQMQIHALRLEVKLLNQRLDGLEDQEIERAY